jgi:hypothetical protein
MLLVKTPIPVPSTVLVGKAIVGLGAVLHTTPLAVTGAPPSAVTSPPVVAVVVAIAVAGVVITVANTAGIGKVVKLKTAP